MKLLTLCTLVLLSLAGFTQPCTILPASNKVCHGGTVTFARSPVSATDSAFFWSFGEGSTNTQSGPTFQYPLPGTYQVNLRIYKFGGTWCDAAPVTIRVLARPNANFNITSKDSQCFKGNSFTFQDLSGPGASNAPLRKRIMLFGDGAFNNQTPPFTPVMSHNYTDINGGKYTVVLEVEDTNGCISQRLDSVVVHRRIEAYFAVVPDMTCNVTRATFTNQSTINPLGAKATWYFGDGHFSNGDSAFNGIVHDYHGNTDFVSSLAIVDRFGCRDSFVNEVPIMTFIPDSNAYFFPLNKTCFQNNYFMFSNPTRFGNFKWEVRNAPVLFHVDTLFRNWEYWFPTCGVYNIKLLYNFNNCKFETDTHIVVYGPQARIENDTIAPINWIQCGTHDTVIFRPPDLNCYQSNTAGMKYFWDFDDDFAPNCTTYTKAGINVGLNCRYSRDSMNVKHFYSQPDVRCYNVKMWVADTVLNCSDTDYVTLRLASPDAGWDSTVVPPRYGAYVMQPGLCDDSGSEIFYQFDRLLPLCGPEVVWIMPDTTCPLRSWIRADSIGKKMYYKYSRGQLCGNFDSLVFGLVARNGKDAAGNYCYDTAYYNYKVKVRPVLPMQLDLIDEELCTPHLVRFFLNDSIQKKLKRMSINFADNSPNYIRDFLLPADTIVNTVYHSYTTDGDYRPTITFTDKDNCSWIVPLHINIGEFVEVFNNTPNLCNGQEGDFRVEVYYRSNLFLDYWNDTVRSDQGKEQIWWNFGDDNTWTRGFERARHKYTTPGTYQVRIAYKDSSTLFCYDTLVSNQLVVVVSSVEAKIYTEYDTFYCAPAIVKYVDSSYALFNNTIPDPTLIINRVWTFDHTSEPSTLPVAAIFYGENGVRRAMLYVESVFGCSDKDTIDLVILGPTPRFVILEDTFGCAPYTVKLRNQTGQPLLSWIWNFNDPDNTFISTNKDTDITFTYKHPGVYRIDLTGEDVIFNPTTGTFKNCTQKFPFLENADSYHSRQVLVIKGDTLIITSKDTICPQQALDVSAGGTTKITHVNWFWGDTSKSLNVPLVQSASHAYDTTGWYTILAQPIIISTDQCVQPAEKRVFVQKPFAEFSYNAEKYPTFFFQNESQQAVRYLWDFGHPASGQNESTEENPSHSYGNENRFFTVCLMAFDINDCMDSVCKVLPLRSSVKIPNVFTPDNGDEKNDAFDIDIEGWELYNLHIYNRWGTLVFEGFKDGVYNDGINWNGNNKNTGEPCPEGTYFVIFKYKLLTDSKEQIYHGTVTLIRKHE